MKRLSLLRVFALATALLLSLGPVSAQPAAPKENLSDAERAKRDAEKVFGFLKFSTVKPAAPAAAPAQAAKVAAPVRVASAAPALSVTKPAAPPPAAATGAASVADPAPVLLAEASPAASVPSTPTEPPLAAAVSPEADAEPEEVPLKLIAYTAPELTSKLMDLLGDRRLVIPVRFKVEADGRVSAAQAVGQAPRALELAATRAVLRWRFAPLPAGREVEVDLAFQAGD